LYNMGAPRVRAGRITNDRASRPALAASSGIDQFSAG